MKLHLPKKLLVAVLAACSMGLTAKAETEAAYTLGNIMYVGDSITHGVASASYRWALHKILVDNDVEYKEVGYAKGNDSNYEIPNTVYCGVEFENLRSAQSSQRAYNTAGRVDTERLDHTSIQNWLGVSTVDTIDPTKKMDGNAYTKDPITDTDAFVLMLGTNDLLSDHKDSVVDKLDEVTTNLLGAADASGKRTGGDMGTIVDTMYASNPNAAVYVSVVPCWTTHGNSNLPATHEAVESYNESLKQWVQDYNAVNGKNMVLVDVNRGLLDVASSTPFYGVSSMFRSPGSDGIHPNAQGELIIAGNLARAMGYGGRTAGLERVAAVDFQTMVEAKDLVLKDETTSLSFNWDGDVTPTGGYTAELMGFTLGNGAADAWNTTENFTITIGNGSTAGTININEAYIQWDNTVLFSEDMSSLTENIRVAYHTGDSDNNIASGYYVWLGDMLIGEALNGSSSSMNGVSLSYSGSSYYTLTGLAMDAGSAYAPTIGLFNTPTNGCVVIPNNVDIYEIKDSKANIYASETSNAVGDVWCKVTAGQATGWAAAQGSGGREGNICMIFSDDFAGSFDDNNQKAAGSVFGAVNSGEGVNGDVTLQFDAENAKYKSFTSTNAASVIGSYKSTIAGTFKAVLNAGTFSYDILGGLHAVAENGNSIGATQIYVNGESEIGGSVYGGGIVGTIQGNTEVYINGGSIGESVYGGGKGDTIKGSTLVVVKGGTISDSVYAGGSAGTIKGDASLVIDGVLSSIGGNIGVSGGGTIEGDGSVTIKNIASGENTRALTTFSGQISGGDNVKGDSTLLLDNAQFSGTSTISQFNSVSLVNGSNVTVGSVQLDDSSRSSISLADNSVLTVGNGLTTATSLSVTGGSGQLNINGGTSTIHGQLSIAQGNAVQIGNGSVLNVTNAVLNDGSLTLQGTLNIDVVSAKGLTISYDPEMVNSDKNAYGAGIVSGFVAGNGSFVNDGGTIYVTYKGQDVNYNAESGEAVIDGMVYYVMNTPVPTGEGSELYYSYGNGKYTLVDSIVTVGDLSVDGGKTYRGPAINTDANAASAIYVGENGTLCIVGDSVTMAASEILTTTQGSGDIIVRAPGYQDEYGDNGYTYFLTVDGKTQVTGDLYLSPYAISGENGNESVVQQTGSSLILEDGADISSFNSVNMNHPETCLVIEGLIGKSENRGHVNNLTASGSAATYIFMNQGASEELILSGDTTIQTFAHAAFSDGSSNSLEQGSSMNLIFNQNGEISIQNLKSPANDDPWLQNYLIVYSAYGNNYDHDAVVHGVVNIDSFDYRGYIYMSALTEGALHVNLNLLKEQVLYDYQYDRETRAMGAQTMTITGSGTYVLSSGNSILSNFGVVSTDLNPDGTHVWTGTVEVNNLGPVVKSDGSKEEVSFNFELYGNEESTVRFNGFSGYIFNTTAANAYKNITIGQDLELYNSTTVGSVAPNAFELSNGFSDQNLSFKGDIRGTGDFVISTKAHEHITFSGDVSQWTDGAELKVTAKSSEKAHSVSFVGEASEINADIKTSNTGWLELSIAPDAEESTVNGSISQADASTLKLSVGSDAEDKTHRVTFNNTVVAASLSTTANGTALFNKTAKFGNVELSSRDKENAASVAAGAAVSGNRVAGGSFSNTDIKFSTDNQNSVSGVEMMDSSITALAGCRVTLDDVNAQNVKLYGTDVNFISVGNDAYFKLQSVSAAGINQVYMDTEVFNGMTLANDSKIELTVDNSVDWNNTNLNDVHIFFRGFTIDGIGSSGEGWLEQISILGDAPMSVFGTALTADNLLTSDYNKITYQQMEDGLHIYMTNVIPEPTTATLSLLALAALAARRRRK